MENVVSMIEDATHWHSQGAGPAESRFAFVLIHTRPVVFVDRIQIQQVLINLMRNAMEAMAASDQRELEVRTSLLNDETVEIAVADSGPGLST